MSLREERSDNCEYQRAEYIMGPDTRRDNKLGFHPDGGTEIPKKAEELRSLCSPVRLLQMLEER